MIALLLTGLMMTGVARSLAAPAPPACIPVEVQCPRVPCGEECWAVLAQYVINLAPEDMPPDLRTRHVLDGGLWGNEAGAACHAGRIIKRGIEVEHPLEVGRRMIVTPSFASWTQILEGPSRISP